MGAGNGGSGIVVVRYELETIGTAKATGGQITFTDTKVIHTFMYPGTFTANESLTCNFLMCGGGGGGGADNGGGGGGGEVVKEEIIQFLLLHILLLLVLVDKEDERVQKWKTRNRYNI